MSDLHDWYHRPGARLGAQLSDGEARMMLDVEARKAAVYAGEAPHLLRALEADGSGLTYCGRPITRADATEILARVGCVACRAAFRRVLEAIPEAPRESP